MVKFNNDKNNNVNNNTKKNNDKSTDDNIDDNLSLKCSHCKEAIQDNKFYYDYYNNIKLHIKCSHHI
jgi:hypothetical protein